MFQRPCCSVLLPAYYLATTVVNEYDHSIFSMEWSLGQLSRNCPHRGGNFERGEKALSCGREAVWEAF